VYRTRIAPKTAAVDTTQRRLGAHRPSPNGNDDDGPADDERDLRDM